MAQHPLVVQRHLLARLAEVLRRGRGRGVVDDPVVEVHHRHVGLGDDEVLVVAGVRDQRGPLPVDARQVVALLGGVRPDLLGGADLEVQPVGLVELGGCRVARPHAVQGVQVEPRRATLHELGRRDVLAERDVRTVEGQVVVDELAEVGVAGRHVALPAAALDHRDGQPLDHGRPERVALRAAAGEPERRRLAGCQLLGSGGGRLLGLGERVGCVPVPSSELGTDQPLALDEEGLGTMVGGHALDARPQVRGGRIARSGHSGSGNVGCPDGRRRGGARVRRPWVGVDGGALVVAEAGGAQDLLHHGVLALAVLLDVGGRRRHPPLHGGVLVAQRRVRAQGVAHGEVVAQCQGAVDDDVRVVPRPVGRVLERPPLGDPQLADGVEPERDQDVRRGLDVLLGHHDVAVDDGLRRQARDRRAAHVLDRHERHARRGEGRGVRVTKPLEQRRPRLVVLDHLDHGRDPTGADLRTR